MVLLVVGSFSDLDNSIRTAERSIGFGLRPVDFGLPMLFGSGYSRSAFAMADWPRVSGAVHISCK